MSTRQEQWVNLTYGFSTWQNIVSEQTTYINLSVTSPTDAQWATGFEL